MTENNLKRYKVVTIHDAIKLLEDAGESVPPETAGKASSLDRGNLVTSTRGAHVLHSSQKGKKDTLTFTMGVSLREEGVLVCSGQLLCCSVFRCFRECCCVHQLLICVTLV